MILLARIVKIIVSLIFALAKMLPLFEGTKNYNYNLRLFLADKCLYKFLKRRHL